MSQKYFMFAKKIQVSIKTKTLSYLLQIKKKPIEPKRFVLNT